MSDQSKEEEVKKMLEEPDISNMDWNLGSHILAQWKAGLPERICQLFSSLKEIIRADYGQEEVRKLLLPGHFLKQNSPPVVEDLREKIIEILCEGGPYSELADSILALIEEEGYMKLIPDPLKGTPIIKDIAKFVDSASEDLDD